MISKNVERYKAGIYKISNLVNGKIYVGSSINVYNRKHTHINKLKNKTHSCKHLEYAYHKYGEDNFLFEVLEYCNNITEREQHYIDLLKPQYNKRLIAQNNTGLEPTQATKDKISATLKDNYINGQETYKQQNKWKEVEQYDLDGNYIATYKNYAEAEKEIKCTVGKMCLAVTNNSKYLKGFQWKVKGSDKIIKKITLGTRGKEIKVTNIILNKSRTYPTLANMCIELKLNKSGVNKAIANNRIYKEKYKFEYTTEVQYKSGELMEKPEVVNHEPSIEIKISLKVQRLDVETINIEYKTSTSARQEHNMFLMI